MKLLLRFTILFRVFSYFSVLASPSSENNTPSFLSDKPQERTIIQRMADRNRIEDDRSKHAAHLHVQMATAAVNGVVGLTKSYIKYKCTSNSCPKKKEEARENYENTKKNIFQPAKQNKRAAQNVYAQSLKNKKELTEHWNLVLHVQQVSAKGQPISKEEQDHYNHITNLYSNANNSHARKEFDEQRSESWRRGQSVSRAARHPTRKPLVKQS